MSTASAVRTRASSRSTALTKSRSANHMASFPDSGLHSIVCLSLLSATSFCCAFAQSDAPGSDPLALALALQATSAITGQQPISDITLTGNVSWSAGTDEVGTVFLRRWEPDRVAWI
jgi:hypothetical protein